MINIKTDSRKVVPGDIFVALQGISSDGHDYIEKAIQNGATKIVATHGSYSVETEIVEDTREYLNTYLEQHYNSYLEEMTIIGVTGTNGKTTSAYLVSEALNKLGKKCAYIGTIGFYMGEKVKSLENTSPDACDLYEYIITAYDHGYRYIALEASSHGLYLKRICTIPFDYAAFTNLTLAHLELHETMENYALAKQLLFKMLKKGGKAIVNYDDEYKNYYLLPENENITYGFDGGDYQVIDYDVKDFHTHFIYQHNGEKHAIKSKLIGKYNVYNMLISIVILEDMGIDNETIARLMGEIDAPNGRVDTIPYGSNRIIIDYAHTPDGVEKILGAVKEVKPNHLYTIFCCCGRRDRHQRPLIAKLAVDNSDYAIMSQDHSYDEDPAQIISDATKDLKETNYEVIWERNAAIRKGMSLLKDHDVLLILGKGHEEYIIINGEHVPQNDRKTVLAEIKKKECEKVAEK